MRLRIKAIWLLLVLCFALCASAAFGADDSVTSSSNDKGVRADMVRISTPIYLPSFNNFDPPLGEYTFSVSWQGIPAAYLTLKIDREKEFYRVIAEAKTIRAIEIFYSLKYRGESLLSALDLSPVRTVIFQQENSRVKDLDMTFEPNGFIRSVYTKKGNPTEVLEFNPENFTLDPFSSGFLARSQEWDIGTVREFDTFDGKNRYLITLRCTGSDTVDVEGVEREAWVIEPEVKNLTNPKNNKKLRSAKIYLSKDKSREILKLVSKVFIGSVTTSLESFVPYERTKKRTTLALGPVPPHGS